MAKDQTIEKLKQLEGEALKNVLSRFWTTLEQEPELLLEEEQIREKIEKDRELLRAAATELRVDLSGPSSADDAKMARDLLVTIYQNLPEHRPALDKALSETADDQVKLDFGLSPIILNLLALAIAGAILRPKISYEGTDKSDETAGKEKRSTHEKSRKFEFTFLGNEGLGSIITAIKALLTRNN